MGGGYIIIDEGGSQRMRSEMRENMRRQSNRYWDGNYRHGSNKTYEDGYREGYEHGWKDHDEYSDSENYRRERDSRGRYI